MIGLAALLVASAAPAAPAPTDDGTPLSLADLPAYRAALAPGAGGAARPVAYRDLWDHPESYRGRRVLVAGRVARSFRQAPLGTFPALVEVWVVAPGDNPLCLVYPERTGVPAPEAGAPIRFAGIFLKRLRYQGADALRLAPLIVGDRPPTVADGAGRGWPAVDWALALGAAALVVVVLVGRHLGSPPRRRRVVGPPPEWVEPGGTPADAEE